MVNKMDVRRPSLPLPLSTFLTGKSAMSLSKGSSNPSLILHRNAVHREELMRKKADLDKRRYKALDELKHEESNLRGHHIHFWHSLNIADDNIGIKIPGFRFKANGDYKKSIPRMREERLKESLKELRKQRSSRGPLSPRESPLKIAVSVAGRQGVPDQQDAAAATVLDDTHEDSGSFVYPHLAPSHSVRKVHCQLGLESRPPSLLTLSKRADTLGHGVNTENALQLLYKALKNPAMEDVARRSLAKLVDWEGPAHSSGRMARRRRCSACRHSLLQPSQVDSSQNEASADSIFSRPRWCLAPAAAFIPTPAKGVSTPGSSSQRLEGSGGGPSFKTNRPVLTMSSPAIMNTHSNPCHPGKPGNLHASSRPRRSLQEPSPGAQHRPALLPSALQAARSSNLDSVVSVSANRPSPSHQSSRQSPSTMLRPSPGDSKRSSVDDLKTKLKEENDVIMSRVQTFLKSLKTYNQETWPPAPGFFRKSRTNASVDIWPSLALWHNRRKRSGSAPEGLRRRYTTLELPGESLPDK